MGKCTHKCLKYQIPGFPHFPMINIEMFFSYVSEKYLLRLYQEKSIGIVLMMHFVFDFPIVCGLQKKKCSNYDKIQT